MGDGYRYRMTVEVVLGEIFGQNREVGIEGLRRCLVLVLVFLVLVERDLVGRVLEAEREMRKKRRIDEGQVIESVELVL
jgi:hypothetical protein